MYYYSVCGSMVLNGILGEELLEFSRGAQKLKGRLDDAVEHKGGVHEEAETYNLQPLEGLPAKTQRHDPDEQGSAGVDGGARRGAHGAGDGQTKEVEATA